MTTSNQSKLAIIYFSSTDWDATQQRPQHLASRLTRYGQVLYVNSLGLRVPLLRDLKRILQRVASSINRGGGVLPISALTILSPLFFLPFPSSPWASRINGWFLRRSLNRWIARQGDCTLVLWVGIPSPAVVEAVKGLAAGLLVYDCIDNFAAFHKNRPDIIETERRLAASAQVIFATSADLFEKMELINPRTFLIPNAVDFEHFSTTLKQSVPHPQDLELKAPILGYVGEIAEWFDRDLIYALAVHNPNWSIALIGNVHVDVSRILRLPNVHYLGLKNYADIPGYLNRFDVCLLPFKVNALTNAVNSIKFYEYLAMGKPVVSTPMREVQRYRDIVEIADRSEFPKAVENALQSAGNENLIRRRLQVASENTWDLRATEIIRILKESLGVTMP